MTRPSHHDLAALYRLCQNTPSYTCTYQKKNQQPISIFAWSCWRLPTVIPLILQRIRSNRSKQFLWPLLRRAPFKYSMWLRSKYAYILTYIYTYSYVGKYEYIYTNCTDQSSDRNSNNKANNNNTTNSNKQQYTVTEVANKYSTWIAQRCKVVLPFLPFLLFGCLIFLLPAAWQILNSHRIISSHSSALIWHFAIYLLQCWRVGPQRRPNTWRSWLIAQRVYTSPSTESTHLHTHTSPQRSGVECSVLAFVPFFINPPCCCLNRPCRRGGTHGLWQLWLLLCRRFCYN